MKYRPSTSAAAEALVIVSLLVSCTGQDEPGPVDSGSPVFPDSGSFGLPDSGATGGLDSGAGGGLDSGSAACPGGGTAGGGGATAGAGGALPATFETVKLVFGGGSGIMPCSAAPCHGINGAAPPDHPLELPPMDDQRLHANLLSYVSKACGDKKLVDPCNPAQSALITILRGPCGVTPRMPYGCSDQAGDCIPEEYIAAVAQWIANGAPRP